MRDQGEWGHNIKEPAVWRYVHIDRTAESPSAGSNTLERQFALLRYRKDGNCPAACIARIGKTAVAAEPDPTASRPGTGNGITDRLQRPIMHQAIAGHC